jgi:D-proline reductase (dithiol) PrdB
VIGVPRFLDPVGYRDDLEQWLSRVAVNHHDFHLSPNAELAFTRPSRPLAECTVALVSTAGPHLIDQEPFDVDSHHGDPTYRVIPAGTGPGALAFTHTHYDHSDADADPDCMFPLARLKELASAGTIGGVASEHFGMMGFLPNPARIREETAPQIAARLKAAGVHLAVLSPG